MGMTINKAMEILTAENFNGYSMSEIIEARNMTLDIMKKYQKIQKVLERIWNIPSHLINKEQCLDRIMETYKEIRE